MIDFFISHRYALSDEESMLPACDDVCAVIARNVQLIRRGDGSAKVPDDMHAQLCAQLAKDPSDF